MFNKPIEEKIIERVQDPNTGETIHRMTLPPESIEMIRKAINSNGQTMNEFVMNSNQYFAIQKRQLELLELMKKADAGIKDVLGVVMKKNKMDMKKPWAFNIMMNMMEYRTPPVVAGMSEAEIKASNSPGIPPRIIDKPGIVA